MSNEFKNEASRRGLLRAGLMIIAGGAAVAATAARADDNDSKVDQSVVQYQTTPKDGAMCSGCVNFVAPNACKVVKGVINPNGWCVAYAPKGS
jgi:hypothetical protein